jgi:photosystem II stability/assembly factor-like uncharacterized protein
MRWDCRDWVPLLLLSCAGCPSHPIAPIKSPPIVFPLRPLGMSEFQPEVSRGGRGVAVDVNPMDPNTVLVASESGGLFWSGDGGTHWKRVDSFPSTGVSELRFVPATEIVMATTTRDGWVDGATNNAGVWRSVDAGATWAKVSLPCGAGVHDAFGIGFMASTNDVYVATDCGLVVSHTVGASFSTVLFPQSVQSVVPHAASLIDICTSGGNHLRSSNAGSTWQADPTTPPRPTCQGARSIAVSPLEDQVLFATAGKSVLESDNAGSTWSDLLGQPYNDRPVWVVTRSIDPSRFDLYVPGERKACAASGPGLRCLAAWARVPDSSLNHDLNAVAFPRGGNCPAFMVNDFGIVKGDPLGSTSCSDGKTWDLIGGGVGGYDALQLYQVIGQADQQGGHTRLYLGTMDNQVWANDDARTSGWIELTGSEGWALDTAHAASPIDVKFLGVTGAGCSPCSNFYFPRTPSGGWGPKQSWPTQDPPGATDPPTLIEPKVYVQFKGNDLYLTTDMGATWTKVATLTMTRIGQPQVAGPIVNPTVYQSVLQQSGGARLAKITGFRSAAGSAQMGTVVNCIGAGCLPAHGSGLSNLQTGCTLGPCLGAFAVDPNDADHLIAADAGAKKMKVSYNGGEVWSVDDQLTGAVTMNGRLTFETQPISFYFDRANSSRVFVGTNQAGLIGSIDGGKTWTTFVDSPKLTSIMSVFFDATTSYAYVASYSRGLWRLNLDPANYQQRLEYAGATSASSPFPVTLAATFFNDSRTPALPIANARISFEIGSSGPRCEALTDGNGLAQCNAQVWLSRGTYTVTARFSGDAQYASTSVGAYFYRQ